MEKSLKTDLVRTERSQSGWIRMTAVVIMVLVVFAALVLENHERDPNAFIMMGERFRDLNGAGDLGYDGQFVYYIASNPLDGAAHIDNPAYRYQRILYPFLSWLFSMGGNKTILPWTMLGLNVVALAIGCGFLGQLLQQRGGYSWQAIGLILCSGTLIAFRADLNEPMAILFSVIGLYFAYREDWVRGGIAFALAVLAKETAFAFLLGTVGWLLLQRGFRIAVKLFLIGLAPAVVWGLLLRLWLGQSPIDAQQAAFELIPFWGLRFIGVSPLKVVILIWVALPALVLGVLGLKDLVKRDFSLETMVILANVGLIAFMPRLTWINVAGALRATIGLVVISLIYFAQKKPRLVPWVLAFWVIPGIALLPVMIIGPYVN